LIAVLLDGCDSLGATSHSDLPAYGVHTFYWWTAPCASVDTLML
jgi:hypothetical protein